MKLKKQKFYVWGLMITMIAVYGFFPIAPNANAVGTISEASDILTDSDVLQIATHQLSFTTATATPSGGYIEVSLPAAFGTIGAAGDITCPVGGASVASLQDGDKTARCAYAGGLAAAALTMTIADVQNPNSEATQYIMIYNRNSSDVILDKVKIAVVIIEDVLVTATVDSFMEFLVVGTTTPSLGAYNCSYNNSQTPTATTVPFGTLPTGDPINICQQLNVTTNSRDGYVVTVEQDHELLADSGADINSFNNSPTGTGSTTPGVWAAPTNTLDSYNTYGHLAITTNDDALIALSGLSDFYTTEQLFAGLNSSDVMTVMDHDGPSDGTTQNVGLTTIMYRAEIMSLQEAGDYESTLTYICTPTF